MTLDSLCFCFTLASQQCYLLKEKRDIFIWHRRLPSSCACVGRWVFARPIRLRRCYPTANPQCVHWAGALAFFEVYNGPVMGGHATTVYHPRLLSHGSIAFICTRFRQLGVRWRTLIDHCLPPSLLSHGSIAFICTRMRQLGVRWRTLIDHRLPPSWLSHGSIAFICTRMRQLRVRWRTLIDHHLPPSLLSHAFLRSRDMQTNSSSPARSHPTPRLCLTPYAHPHCSRGMLN